MSPADLGLEPAIADFARDLRLDKSPKTISTYTEACRLFAAYASGRGVATIGGVDAALVRAWLTDLRDRGRSQATIFNRHSGLKAFFRWAVAERLVDDNPLAAIPMRPAAPPPIPVLRPDQLGALLRTCDGESFEDIRDAALLRLLIDTGMRRAECATLRVTDLDMEQEVATVLGKGSRIRGCPFGARTARALRRYLRARASHDRAHQPELWLGLRGPLKPNALLLILRRRARQAGIASRVFVHQLRHTWASEALGAGMNESDVQRLGGWRDRDMLARYGANGADERAKRAYRSRSLADRL